MRAATRLMRVFATVVGNDTSALDTLIGEHRSAHMVGVWGAELPAVNASR